MTSSTRKKRSTTDEARPALDIFLNPDSKSKLAELKEQILGRVKTYFSRSSFHKSYPALFRLLWHSALPCTEGTNHFLKRCSWAGEDVDCSQLFQPVPTDFGMCCSFNYRNSLRNSSFSRLLQKMGRSVEESLLKKATVGKRNGLRLFIDQHTNLKSFGTESRDNYAVQVYVGGSTEFPLIRDKGFLLEPGKEHYVEISAVSVKARDSIKTVSYTHLTLPTILLV